MKPFIPIAFLSIILSSLLGPTHQKNLLLSQEKKPVDITDNVSNNVSDTPVKTVALNATINPPIEVDVHTPIEVRFDITLPENWEATDKVLALDDEWTVTNNISYIRPNDNYSLWYIWAPPGHHEIIGKVTLINWTKQDAFKKSYKQLIYVKGSVPVPSPEPDEEDDDDDVDPEPNPQPSQDDPWKDLWKNSAYKDQIGKKLVVLIVEENDDRYRLDREKLNIFRSAKVRTFLDLNAVIWRIEDDDTNFASDPASQRWQKALELAKKPFGVVASNGKKWINIELPANEDQFIAELQKLLGQ